MKIITDIFNTRINKDMAVAIGKFDGLHLGHQKLLQEILKMKSEGLLTCVFTFEPSPAVFFGRADGKELMTKEEKQRDLDKMGIDVLVEFPMNHETATMEPEIFVKKILVESLRTKYIAAGNDVSFGAKGAGDAELLERLSGEQGYQLCIIDKVSVNGTEISSSLVRSQVEKGNLQYVKELMGRPYSILGSVMHGRALGRTLGMPTLNLEPINSKLLPPNGVYYAEVTFRDKKYHAITNIGYKPTVSQEKRIGIETYLYDFDEEIYGEEIMVSLLEYKRSEKCFRNVDELKKQMEQDIREGKLYHLCKRG